MRNRLVAFLIVLIAVCGCDHAATAHDPSVSALSAPLRFAMRQRTTMALPGAQPRIWISLGDITAGQVLTTLTGSDGGAIIATQSLRPGQVLRFSTAGQEFHLDLARLDNRLVGEDHAHFDLRVQSWTAALAEAEALSETEKIEALLASLRSLQNAKLIRNGTPHTVDDAIQHLLRKWHAAQGEIKTAEDFIVKIGSRSSSTGLAYVIRLPDGTETTTETWFRQQLANLPR